MRCALLVALLGLACDSSTSAHERVVLHVSTGYQLSELSIGSGAAVFVRDLIGTWVHELFEVDKAETRDGEIWLRLRDNIDRPMAELCQLLRSPAMVGLPEVRGDRCVVRFSPRRWPNAAPEVDPRVWSLHVDNGPFEIVRTTDARRRPEYDCSLAEPEGADEVPLYETMVLERRGRSHIDEIHVHSLSMAEQWRHLIAGRTQVAPQLPMLYRAWLETMTTIQTIELEPSGPIFLLFNTRAAPWSDRDVRRELARALDLDAVARVACLHPTCRGLGVQRFDARADILPPEARVELPRELAILVVATDWSSTQAASAIGYQLRKHRGIEVRIERCPVTVVHSAVTSGTFGLVVTPLEPFPGTKQGDYQESMNLTTRYWNPRLEAAVNARDEHAFAQLVREDVFVLPLFRNLFFAAVDSRFCDARPTEVHTWAWLAALRPCEPGETP